MVKTMEKLIEKMGLYDIWTTLFPGAFFCVSIKSIYDFMLALPAYVIETKGLSEQIFIFLKMNIYAPNTIYKLLIFLFFSYFLGLILQEISSMFKKLFLYKKGQPIDFLLDSKWGIFNDAQIQALMPIYIQFNGNNFTLDNDEKQKEESRTLFHKINAYLQRMKIANKYVKLNIICNTCATLGVAVMLMLFIASAFEIEFVVFCRRFDILISIICFDVILIISIYIFIYKSKKYYIFWVRNLIFAYQDLYLTDNCGANE